MRPLHRPPRSSWFLVWVALSGCAAQVRSSPPELPRLAQAATEASPPDRSPPSDQMRLQADRSYKGKQAVGRAVLKLPPTLEALRAKHEKLAVARAWLSLAEQSGHVGDWSGTVECAQAGRRELGELREPYPRRGVLDDSGMHWIDAEIQLKQGQVKAAAEVMLRILKLRIDFYVRYYSQEIAE